MSSKSDVAYQTLRRRIFSGEMPPGHHISERALCDEIDLGRTPVREAVLRLENEGLIQPDAAGGRVVRIWAPSDVRARRDIRLAIESLAVRYAVERPNADGVRLLLGCCERGEALVAAGDYEESVVADLHFHVALLRASGNREIVRAGRLLPMSATFLPGPNQDFAHDMREAFDEHRAVARYIGEAEADRAVALLVEHLTRGAERMITWLEERIANGELRAEEVEL